MVFLLSEADLESGIRPKRVGLEKDRIWIWMKYSLNLSLCLDGRFSLKGIKRKRTSNSQYSLSIWLFLNSGRLLEQYSLRLPLLLLLSGSPEDRYYVGHRSLRLSNLCNRFHSPTPREYGFKSVTWTFVKTKKAEKTHLSVEG